MSERFDSIRKEHDGHKQGWPCDVCYLLDLLDELTPEPAVKPRRCVCCGGPAGNPELCDRCAQAGYEAQQLDLRPWQADDPTFDPYGDT